MKALLEWLNESLEDRRIILKDIVEDLYDGFVLGELAGMSYMYIRTCKCVILYYSSHS